METNKPIKEIRLGAIKAAIWKSNKEGRVNHSVKITRIYKQDDNWKDSNYFSKTDLALVTKVADLAHTYIYQENNQQ